MLIFSRDDTISSVIETNSSQKRDEVVVKLFSGIGEAWMTRDVVVCSRRHLKIVEALVGPKPVE